MEVHNTEEDGFLVLEGLFLKCYPVGDGTKIVAEMGLTRWLNPAENDGSFLGLRAGS
jgi:hypothetical protein